MNKIAALAFVAGLGAEIGCAETPLEKQALEFGIELNGMRETRAKLLAKLGVDDEGFCDNTGIDACTDGDPYSVQCAFGGDAINAYINAIDAAKADVVKHVRNKVNLYSYSEEQATPDGFGMSCVKSVADTGTSHSSSFMD